MLLNRTEYTCETYSEATELSVTVTKYNYVCRTVLSGIAPRQSWRNCRMLPSTWKAMASSAAILAFPDIAFPDSRRKALISFSEYLTCFSRQRADTGSSADTSRSSTQMSTGSHDNSGIPCLAHWVPPFRSQQHPLDHTGIQCRYWVKKASPLDTKEKYSCNVFLWNEGSERLFQPGNSGVLTIDTLSNYLTHSILWIDGILQLYNRWRLPPTALYTS